MKPIRTLLALAFVSLFASSAALAAEKCPLAAAKAEKSACCSSADKDADKGGCCGEKSSSSSCCSSAAKKDFRKGQTPSGK